MIFHHSMHMHAKWSSTSSPSSLSSGVNGMVKFHGKAECFDDWKEQVNIKISNAKR